MNIKSAYYSSNMRLLKKHHPSVWEAVSNEDVLPLGEIVRSVNGELNLLVETQCGSKIALHDVQEPHAEGTHFLAMIDENSTNVVVLLGMGLGYGPMAILRSRALVRHLIVIEKDPGIFKQALVNLDLSAMLEDSRLILSVGENPDLDKVFSPATRALQLEAINTLRHVPSFSYGRKFYDELDKKVFAFINNYNVSGATTMALGGSFVRNRMANLSAVQHSHSVEELKGAFEGIPAIIVAGGPSLDKNIDQLIQAKNKAVIIAVDTVLPTLLARGISPDFLTSIDPEEFILDKFASALPKADKVSLICSACVSPKVPKIFPPERVFYAYAGKPMETWVNSFLGGKMLTGGAGTVAHLNFIAAKIMGCSPIIFVGQDLAFSETRDHAENTFLGYQQLMDGILNSEDVIWVEGIEKGTKVPTMRAFYSMKVFFEKMMANEEGHYINATEGGAHLEGAEAMALAEVVKLYCFGNMGIEQKVDCFVKKKNTKGAARLIKEFRNKLTSIKQIKKLIKKCNSTTRFILKEVSSLKNNPKYSSFQSLSPKIQRMVRDSDVYSCNLDKLELWTILDELTMEGLRKSERSRQSMKHLEDNPEKYLEWLTQVLERLEYINSIRSEILQGFSGYLRERVEHFDKETHFSSAIAKGIDVRRNVLRLLDLFFSSGDLALLNNTIEKHRDLLQNSAEALFYSGVVAAHRTEYDEADGFFEEAMKLDGEISYRIEEYRRNLSNEYFKYALRFKQDDENSCKRLLLKGLRYFSKNHNIRGQLVSLVEQDINVMQNTPPNGESAKSEPLVKLWHKGLVDCLSFESILPAQQVAYLYRAHGEMLFHRGELHEALADFDKAIENSPQDPSLYIALVEVYFGLGDYSSGLACLKKAVGIDVSCAKYWENIGDNLCVSGLHEEAVYAFEECFKALPGNYGLLKKLGDCYLAMEKPEAALEAYSQLKNQARQLANGAA